MEAMKIIGGFAGIILLILLVALFYWIEQKFGEGRDEEASTD